MVWALTIAAIEKNDRMMGKIFLKGIGGKMEATEARLENLKYESCLLDPIRGI